MMARIQQGCARLVAGVMASAAVYGIAAVAPAEAATLSLNANNSGSFEYTGELDTLTIVKGGIYKIDAYGAAGGAGGYSTAGRKGGRLQGNFNLSAGQVLSILIGGMGGDGRPGSYGYGTGRNGASGGGGGGGGTFVATILDRAPIILISAGGGFGGSDSGGYGGYASGALGGAGGGFGGDGGKGGDGSYGGDGGDGGDGGFGTNGGDGGDGSYGGDGGNGGDGGDGGFGGGNGGDGGFGTNGGDGGFGTNGGNGGNGGDGGNSGKGGNGGTGIGKQGNDIVLVSGGVGGRSGVGGVGGIGGSGGYSSYGGDGGVGGSGSDGSFGSYGGDGGTGIGTSGFGGSYPAGGIYNESVVPDSIFFEEDVRYGNGFLEVTYLGTSAVPEPLTIVGTIFGGTSLLVTRRRRKSAKARK